MAQVSAKVRALVTQDESNQAIRTFLHAKAEEARAKKIQGEVKSEVMDFIDESVEEDENGHKTFALPSETEGFVSIQRQRRVSRGVDEDAAAEISRSHRLGKSLYQTVLVLDESAVFAAMYAGKLTEDEVERIFPEKVTFALVPQKA